jgi:hypothetical protein
LEHFPRRRRWSCRWWTAHVVRYSTGAKRSRRQTAPDIDARRTAPAYQQPGRLGAAHGCGERRPYCSVRSLRLIQRRVNAVPSQPDGAPARAEERRSIATACASMWREKVSGGLVVAQRGREFHEPVSSLRERSCTVEEALQRARWGANHVLEAIWLIGALFEFLTRIGVVCLAKVLTPHPPSASTQPLSIGYKR